MINTKRQPPVSTATLPQLLEAIGDRDCSAAGVAAVVAHDPGLVARVLAVANSAQFGLTRRVVDVERAIALICTSMVQTLAIASGAALLDPHDALPRRHDHAVRVATAARLLAPAAGVRPSDAFAGGLLHDIGELLLLQVRPTEYAELVRTAPTHLGQLRAEKVAFGTDHALAGAEHLLEWRVPDVIADAVADHHDPFHTSSATTIVVAAADELISAEAGRTHALDLLEVDVAAADGLRERVEGEAADLFGLLAQPRL
jgi:putative nucleotidyltransferase with HDIG domain